jgi:hypothetical protein
MSTDIDIEAYNYIDKVQQHISSKEHSTENAKLFGAGTTPIATFDEVSNFSITEFDEDDFSTKTRYVDVDGKMLGLNSENYSKLVSLITPLLETNFKSKCDLKFLAENAFNWIIETYRKQKAGYNLTAYLTDRIAEETREYHFYYRVSAVAIERPIEIGNVLITYFSDDEILDYYNAFNDKNPGKTLGEFKKLHSHIFKSVVAHIKVKSVDSIAETISLKEVELAVDILKCFCFTYSLNKLNAIPDLDFRINSHQIASYWSLVDGDINQSNLRLKRFGGIAPMNLTDTFIRKAGKIGFNTFSEFIKSKSDNELYFDIIELIKQYAAIISTNDNYEKVVQAISLLENIVIPKDAKGKGKGHNRVKKVISKLINNVTEQELLNRHCTDIYKVRNRYLHNYDKLPFEKDALKRLLFFELKIIHSLIQLNKHMQTMDDVLVYFEISNAN